MIVPVGFAIIPAGAISEFDLMDQAFIPQKSERVVNRGKTDSRQVLSRGVEDLGGRGMMISRLHRVEHHLTLPGQSHRLCFALLFSHGWNYNNSKFNVKWRGCEYSG